MGSSRSWYSDLPELTVIRRLNPCYVYRHSPTYAVVRRQSQLIIHTVNYIQYNGVQLKHKLQNTGT
jgi:hypothetical protein